MTENTRSNGADRELVEALRAKPEVSDHLVNAVMADVRVRPIPRTENPLRVSRYLLAAGVVLAAAALWRAETRGSVDPVRAASASNVQLVRFTLAAPGVQHVSVSGDFNRWTPRPLDRGRDGVWSIEIPLTAGRYSYSFVVEGKDATRWVADPSAPSVPDDGFGRPSSVVIVEATRSS